MKKILAMITSSVFIVLLTACSNNTLKDAKSAVDEYNGKINTYTEKIKPYNEAVQKIADANKNLEDVLNDAQSSLDKGETPYNSDTITSLNAAMTSAKDLEITTPDMLPAYNNIVVNEGANKKELENITEQAKSDSEKMSSIQVPKIPSIPDYKKGIKDVKEKQQLYEDSIQSLKQITAPSDEFVKERLKRVKTITDMAEVTEKNDPNGKLNKQGGYIGCVYFTDKQVNRSELYLTKGKDSVIDVGTNGGGAIEIFSSTDDAKTRDNYLAAFDGTAVASGGHYVVGTILIRTSDQLTGTQQKKLTDEITKAFLWVKH